MGYLTSADLKRVIQTANLNDIVGNDTNMITYAEQAAITEAVSYLSPKYSTELEFTNTLDFDAVAVYYYNQRIVLDASNYNASNSYMPGEKCLYQGNVYYCPVQTTPGSFDPAEWTLVGKQYSMWYIGLPANTTNFNMASFYKVGDYVAWGNARYKCLKATYAYDHATLLQYGTRENIPPINQFPDASGQQQWQFDSNIELTGDRISQGDFINGDNRNQQLVNYIIDIMLYHLHARISPRNIPELRLERYDNALNWLKQCAKGDDINAGLPRKTPAQGMRIRWGGKVQANYDY